MWHTFFDMINMACECVNNNAKMNKTTNRANATSKQVRKNHHTRSLTHSNVL